MLLRAGDRVVFEYLGRRYTMGDTSITLTKHKTRVSRILGDRPLDNVIDKLNRWNGE